MAIFQAWVLTMSLATFCLIEFPLLVAIVYQISRERPPEPWSMTGMILLSAALPFLVART